ncbi:MAG: hypothetical protein QOK28_3693 [Actinomycetota bacterium]
MTVRFRVTAVATVAVLAVLVASGAVLIHLQRSTLTSSLDESLIRMSHGLLADAAANPSATTLRPHGDEDIVAQLVGSHGEVLAASSNVAGRRRVSSLVPPPRGVHIAEVRPIRGDKIRDRLLTRRVQLRDRGAAILYVGAPVDDIRDNVRFLTRTMAGGIPVIVAILAAIVWWLVGRTLRPVELIRTQVAAIGGRQTDKRVPEPSGDDEIARLAKTMNAMLARIDEATRRQQRFVADASHELRTPLTRMRAEVEVDLAHPEAADPQATHASVLEELTALQRLVEDLLLIARSDADVPAERERMDMGAVVVDEARQCAVDGVVVDTARVPSVFVLGDPGQLRRVARNVIANAVRYARTRVSISLRAEGSGVLLSVEDDGPGVSPEDRTRIFERFTRADDARATATGGVGLGLAIAREIVERHGGTIRVVDAESGGARFEVYVPGRI